MREVGRGSLPWYLSQRSRLAAAGKMPDTTSEFRVPATTIEGELLAFFARMGASTPALALIAQAFVAFIAATHIGWRWPVLWFVVSVVWLPFRAAAVARLPTEDPVLQRRRMTTMFWLSVGNALVYSSSLIFFPYVTETERTLLTLIQLGLCTGAMTAGAGYLPIYGIYIVTMVGSLVLAWSIYPSRTESVWAAASIPVLLFIYGLFLAAGGRNAFTAFKESFDSRQRQVALNGDLQKALAEAETANLAKTRFLAAASHDLRQPIHTLSLFNAALSMQALRQSQSEMVEHQAVALRALASQLDALLDISKLDAGVMHPDVTAVNVRAVLDHLQKEFSAACEEKGLTFTLHSEGRGVLQTDGILLDRILRNLLANAVKYTDAGKVSIEAYLAPDDPRISISDTGRGIPEDEREHIFEEFYQLNNPERDRSKGLGLGLAIVRRLVKMLDMDITMQSEPGHGTSFEVRLPPQQTDGSDMAPAPQLQPEPMPGELAGLRVLVLDDEAAVRVGMQALLEAMGCQVQLADSTDQAMHLTQDQPPGIVLADIRLRGRDNGLNTVRALRGRWPDLPALLISGDTAPERLQEAQAAGLRLLHKPVVAEDLKQTIQDVLYTRP